MKPSTRVFVGYYRVSTAKQGRSGLGLEAQQQLVRAFLDRERGEVLESFTEIETGKGSNALARRPELRKALELCKRRKAVLVIAKLDRLARNVHFVSGLMESGVEFVAADMPTANRVMLHMHAVMSEWEREQISERTKAALAAWKVRNPDKTLGHPRLSSELNARHITDANIFAAGLREQLYDCVQLGYTHYKMAERLNGLRVPTARGGRWHATQVRRILLRLKATERGPWHAHRGKQEGVTFTRY